MMKRPKLDLDDYQSFVLEFHNESDRSAIVMAGSFAESYLATYLRHFMVNDPDEDKDIERMFEVGPLASFDARINIAYALKLIPKKFRDDLRLIKSIRNRFAHAPRVISLDRPDNQSDLKKLSMWAVIRKAPTDAQVERTDRHIYLFSVGMFVVFAHQQIQKNKTSA